MKFYYAPIEGVVGHVYRRAHNAHFNHEHIYKYFTPFIVADQNKNFTTKVQNDLDPENNRGLVLIPQLLTNQADDFTHTAKRIAGMGYQEVNLNLGCPSGTVVSKRRGAGFLAYQDELECFLEAIFEQPVMDISIKTRIGKEQPEEFDALLQIFNKFPLKELIIHPRTQKQMYKYSPDLEVFKTALALSTNPVCYNGDIFTVEDYQAFKAIFPEVETMMLGRGIMANPGLVDLIMDQRKMDKHNVKEFHDQIYQDYQKTLFGDRNVLFKMKEVWFYLIQAFSHSEKYAKKIKKAERLSDYDAVVNSLFNEQEILDSFGHSFTK